MYKAEHQNTLPKRYSHIPSFTLWPRSKFEILSLGVLGSKFKYSLLGVVGSKLKLTCLIGEFISDVMMLMN